MAKARKGNGALRLYKSYMFKDKDPVIDELRTVVDRSKLSYKELHEESGVTSGTIRNWFHGTTRSPKFNTVAAVTSVVPGATLTLKAGKVSIKLDR